MHSAQRRVCQPRKMRTVSLVALLAVATAHSINYTTSIDPNATFGVWQGWGTSLAWWAKAFGRNDTIADLMFTMGPTNFGNDRLPGLGLNIVRYNAGASSDVPASGQKMQDGKFHQSNINPETDLYPKVSPNVSPTRLIDTFWIDWATNASDWDWTRDPNQATIQGYMCWGCESRVPKGSFSFFFTDRDAPEGA